MKKISLLLTCLVAFSSYSLALLANEPTTKPITASSTVIDQQHNPGLKNQNLKAKEASADKTVKDTVKYKVEVVPYNPDWPKMYEVEATSLKQKLGDNTMGIHHVGSTSIPGLNAKPIIDMIVIVKNAASTIPILESMGYEYKGEYNIPFHFSFSKKSNPKVHVHMFEEGNPEIELNLLFRDYLRSHPDALKEYAALKAYLLTQESSFEKRDSKFKGYTLGKDMFIRKVLEKAGFHQIRMMHCTHKEEVKMAKALRQKYVFDKMKVSDPDLDTFDHPEHVHLALYQGTKMIGYAHLQLLSQEKAAVLRMFVIDEPCQNQNFEGKFLSLFEKWLQSKHYQSLQVTTSEMMMPHFYARHGYQDISRQKNSELEAHDYTVDAKAVKMMKMLCLQAGTAVSP